MNNQPYKMTIGLSVLNHLGINLYSNVPAVISEAIANSWDADAEVVDIKINKDEISISDNGCGMNQDELNKKYLHIGYDKRQAEGGITPEHKRPVMGRKGIGKLSLFSIANIIEVQSYKDGKTYGFRMNAEEIKKKIELEKKKDKKVDYHPEPLLDHEISISNRGTVITISSLKKRIVAKTSKGLRQRIARRFGIIGPENKFKVNLNGTEVTISDRDYFHKIQYLWHYGKSSERYLKHFTNVEDGKSFLRIGSVGLEGYKVTGWIGTVKVSGNLKDPNENLNKIVIMVRGKLAQEDILEDFSEGGLYSKYLIGEINADFLDLDDKEDIATSSRQEIIKHDDRYEALKEWVQKELKEIQKKWTDLRNEEGKKKALEIPAVKEWFGSLGPDTKKKAANLFGKINQLTIDSESERKILIKHSVIAFESLKYKENLDALKEITPDNLLMLSEIFIDLEDIESTMYYQIIKERIEVIKTLREKVEENALEKVLQEHVFNNLWLVDPYWDRESGTEYMEQQVRSEFDKINAKLKDEEKKGRVDIKYKCSSGKHIIIELKRADRVVETADLLRQVRKYISALQKLLDAAKLEEPIEVRILVGKPLKDWSDKNGKRDSEETLKPKHIKVILYSELVNKAYSAYQAFLDKNKEAGRIHSIIQSIDEYEFLPSYSKEQSEKEVAETVTV